MCNYLHACGNRTENNTGRRIKRDKAMYTYRKIMVVDDSDVDRFIINRLVTICSFAEEIVLVGSANEAVNYLVNIADPDEIPSLIFLDIRMPDVDGFDFLNIYAGLSDSIKKHSSIIMISSSCDDSDRRRVGINPFIHSFIDKPLSKSKLEMLAASRSAEGSAYSPS